MLPPDALDQGEAPDFSRLSIFGAGGHGRELAWLAKRIWGERVELQFLVDKEEHLSESVNGFQVRLLTDVRPCSRDRFIAAIGDSHQRRIVADQCADVGLIATKLIHPRAELSQWLELGEGCVVCAGSIITANVALGRHVHVNIGCTISHDVRIDDFTTLSPGVHIAGNVHIGKNAFIGIGANIINGKPGMPLVIGDDAVIGAGACVTRSVSPKALMTGVPAMQKL